MPDSDEEPEGFLEASLVFWDMKRVKISCRLGRKNMTFQQSTHMIRNAVEGSLSEVGEGISRSFQAT